MRSSLALMTHLRRSWAGESIPVLSGNVGDLHVGPEGTIVGFEQLLAYSAAADGRASVTYSPGRGTRQDPAPGRAAVAFSGPGPDADLGRALPQLTSALQRCNTPTVLILDWTDQTLGRVGEPPGVVIELLANAATDPLLLRAGHRLAVVDRSGFAVSALAPIPTLRVVVVPLPDFNERREFIEFFALGQRSSHLARINPGSSVEQIACASNGLSLRRLLALMGELFHDGRDLCTDAIAPVKNEFLLQHTEGALRPLPGARRLETIAGLHNVRLLLEEHSNSPAALRHLLLAGPPGTGKSSVIAAIGQMLQMSVVALGELRASLVGESERLTRRLLQTAESMAPVIIFVDEMDQTLSGDDGPSGDSGVTKRINAMLWEWTGRMSAEQGVLFVGATNRPSALGSRVIDRFTTLPVLHPDPAEAAEILRIAAADDNRTIDNDATAEILTEGAALYTGRTLVEILRNATTIADHRHGSKVDHLTGEMLRTALDQVLVWRDDTDQEYMALDAIRHTRIKRYLPWQAARLRGVPYQPPAYVLPFLHADGALDVAALDARMRELDRGRR